jgi:hypothetical protein
VLLVHWVLLPSARWNGWAVPTAATTAALTAVLTSLVLMEARPQPAPMLTQSWAASAPKALVVSTL